MDAKRTEQIGTLNMPFTKTSQGRIRSSRRYGHPIADDILETQHVAVIDGDHFGQCGLEFHAL